MIVPVNAHYHVTAHCVQMKDSAFASDQLIIPVNLQGKIKGNPAYGGLPFITVCVNANANYSCEGKIFQVIFKWEHNYNIGPTLYLPFLDFGSSNIHRVHHTSHFVLLSSPLQFGNMTYTAAYVSIM